MTAGNVSKLQGCMESSNLTPCYHMVGITTIGSKYESIESLDKPTFCDVLIGNRNQEEVNSAGDDKPSQDNIEYICFLRHRKWNLILRKKTETNIFRKLE